MKVIHIPITVSDSFVDKLNKECLLNKTVHGQLLYALSVPGVDAHIIKKIEAQIAQMP